MTIEFMIKAALVGIVAALFSTVIGETKKEYALILKTAAIVMISLSAFYILKEKLSQLNSLFSDIIEYPELITTMFKGLVITVVCMVCSDICTESGSASIASAIQLAGRVMILVLAYPLFEAVIKTALSFAGG